MHVPSENIIVYFVSTFRIVLIRQSTATRDCCRYFLYPDSMLELYTMSDASQVANSVSRCLYFNNNTIEMRFSDIHICVSLW